MSKESDTKARHADDDEAPDGDEAPEEARGDSSKDGDDADDGNDDGGDDADDGDDGGGDDDADDGDGDEADGSHERSDAKPAKKDGAPTSAKPVSKKPSSKRGGHKKAGASRKAGARPGARPAPAPRKGSPMRNLLVFVVLVGGLAAAFGVLGSRTGGGDAPPAPKWKVGETVDVQITLVHTDRAHLGCAMSDEIAGRHCAFEAQNKRSTKAGDAAASDKVLQPFTTTEGVQMMAGGLWTQDALKKDLPKSRFSVKCKLVVEGKTQSAWVQWKPGDPWYSGNGWYTGLLKDCGKPIPQR